MTQKTTVRGFRASAVKAGIKYRNRLDLGLLVSTSAAAIAGVFTRNQVKAAPVMAGIERLKNGPPFIRAVLVNSGNANACTGPRGLADLHTLCSRLAEEMDIDPSEVLMCSTGVIGEPLPVDTMLQAIAPLVSGLSRTGIDSVAEAIMTTDTVPKICTKTVTMGDSNITMAGIAKGAGMIAPTMDPPHATMLSFIMCDARVNPVWWQEALERAVESSFNRITIDGDTSTNDTVLALAGGLAKNKTVCGGSEGDLLEDALADLTQDLASRIVKDGEGVTKCVTIRITGAENRDQAMAVARTVADSPLVKTAFFGEDPNWGRILAAAGRAGVPIRQELLTLRINEIEIVKNGVGTGREAECAAGTAMKKDEFSVTLDLGAGRAEADMLTCDLSDEYIHINADYRT
ncbi:MAG TPA: bifunctional glutamate N-acetyltransferase/amino-acid acetyltransferase ArgJ [Thermodesulfobacteriaceae bacterium]|nr:bifunctional glutamate N-acetyltransferase/amino-acid acetyltransferase ArgJ [Thermodesulfobacteriaceae bacterium]